LFFDNVVEKLTATHVLHDQKKLFWRLNDFEELNDVWVSHHFQDFNLAANTLYVRLFNDLSLFEDFNGDLLEIT
jgi:hypothetical protein